MYVVSMSWLKDDIVNVLEALVQAAQKRAQRHGWYEYEDGYMAAIADAAKALGVQVSLPIEAERSR